MTKVEIPITIKGPVELYPTDIIFWHRAGALKEPTRTWATGKFLEESFKYAEEMCKVSENLSGP